MAQIMILKRGAIENVHGPPPTPAVRGGALYAWRGRSGRRGTDVWTIKLTAPSQRCPVSTLHLIPPQCQKFSSKDLSALQIGGIAWPG